MTISASCLNAFTSVEVSRTDACFHSQSQLRTHERELHSSDVAALTPVTETVGTAEEAERVTDDGETPFYDVIFSSSLDSSD